LSRDAERGDPRAGAERRVRRPADADRRSPRAAVGAASAGRGGERHRPAQRGNGTMSRAENGSVRARRRVQYVLDRTRKTGGGQYGRRGDSHRTATTGRGRLVAALDLVYAPGGTRWARTLRAAGVPAQDGREVLVQQGAAAFGRFFPERAAPVEVMRAAVDRALRA